MKFKCDYTNYYNKGIYFIDSIDGKYRYIGSACGKKGFYGRYYMHLYQLSRGVHHNKRLQSIWNKEPEDYFTFIIHMHITNNSNTIHSIEEQLIQEHLEQSYPKLINLSLNASGGNWTSIYPISSISSIYTKREENYPTWKRQIRNIRHRQTLKNTPSETKQKRIKKHIESYKKNRKTHKSYKPFSITFLEPCNKEYTLSFENDKEFLTNTKFEYTTLTKLKHTKSHTIKRILPSTKHRYPINTKLTLEFKNT